MFLGSLSAWEGCNAHVIDRLQTPVGHDSYKIQRFKRAELVQKIKKSTSQTNRHFCCEHSIGSNPGLKLNTFFDFVDFVAQDFITQTPNSKVSRAAPCSATLRTNLHGNCCQCGHVSKWSQYDKRDFANSPFISFQTLTSQCAHDVHTWLSQPKWSSFCSWAFRSNRAPWENMEKPEHMQPWSPTLELQKPKKSFEAPFA